jgi:hypothetical protein
MTQNLCTGICSCGSPPFIKTENVIYVCCE